MSVEFGITSVFSLRNRRSVWALLVVLALSTSGATAADLTPAQQEEVKLKSGKWMELRQKAESLEKTGKYADAESIFKQIVAERQSLGLDLLTEYDALGSLYMTWGKRDVALKTYQDMVAAREKLNGADDPQVVFPLQQYAACLTKLGKKSEAQAALARVAAIQKSAATMPKFEKISAAVGSPARVSESVKMRGIGEKLLASDQQQKALAYFQRAVLLNPSDANALCDRAEAEFQMDQNAKAGADFDQAIKLKPDLQKAFAGRARFRESQNQIKLAIADFDKAIALDPKDTESMGSRAKLLQENGQNKNAIDGYTKVIATDATLYWPYVQRSLCYSALKQYKPAIADLTVLVDRAPEDYEFREARASVYLKSGDLQNALADYNKVVEFNPKYSIGYHDRGSVLEKIDGKKTARVLADYAMAKKLGYK